MEFSDIELKHSDTKRSDANSYINTTISTESVAHKTTPNSGETGENEGHYEKLRLGIKQTEADRIQNACRSFHWEDLPNRIKYAVYVVIAVIVVLFVVDIVVIVLIALPKDGNWSSWGIWESCSDSCGGGVRSRQRTCTNPRPALHWKYCEGSTEQVMPCSKQACPDHKVAFVAYGSTKETSYAAIKFPFTHLNIGGGYNTSTGRFTCRIPGIYNFAVTLTKIRQDINAIFAFLRVNGVRKLDLFSDPDDNDSIDYGSYSLSVTGNFQLNRNDYVDVKGVPGFFYNDSRTSFTGVLVIPDE